MGSKRIRLHPSAAKNECGERKEISSKVVDGIQTWQLAFPATYKTGMPQ
jgi:hypothetical protein